MDYGKALTFITEDERWKEKIAIGVGVVLLSSVLTIVLIGVIGYLIVMGYCVRLLQNVRDGDPQPLPEWNQWGEDLVRGFKLAVITFVWALPLVVFTIPMSIGGAMADGRGAGEFLGSMIALCAGCLAFLYGLFVAVVTPGYSIAFADDESIGSGLALTRIWQWTQENIGQVIVAMLIIIAAALVIGLAASVVGVLLCGIGLIVTIPLASLITYLFQYHVIGQLAHTYPMYPGRAADIGSPVAPVAEPPAADVTAVAVVPAAMTAVMPVEPEATAPAVEEARAEDVPVAAAPAEPEPTAGHDSAAEAAGGPEDEEKA
jgi:hypothetical protein